MALQIITGVFLAMFYNPNPIFSFDIIVQLTNEFYYG
jgi:quinol-cytochrome oxidoreductase complex cytochrome b subunit